MTEDGKVTQAKTPSRGELRRQAMLDAATELFLEKGFACTSLSDIVSRSKGSRSTLYEQFGNKEGLLRAIIEEVTADIWTVIGPEDASLRDEEALVDVARRFVNAAITPRNLAVYRILVAEGPRLPEIAQLFFERGPRQLHRQLAARFQASCKSCEQSGASERTAQLFLGAVMGVFHLVCVLGLEPKPTAEDIDAHVRLAVRLFLDGVGRSDGAA